MKNLLYFNSKPLEWIFWGTRLSIDLRGYSGDTNSDIPTNNSAPGQESSIFYDTGYDALTEGEVPVGELHAGTSEEVIHNYSEKYDSLIAVRSRFYREWLAKKKGHEYSYQVRGCIFRNSQWGSLYEPDNLKNAHLQFLRLDFKNQHLPHLDIRDGESSISNKWLSALNWRTSTLSGYLLQGYDVLDGQGKCQETWIFPLGDHHYFGISIRIITGRLRCREHVKGLEKFIRGFMASMSLRPRQPALMPKYSGIEPVTYNEEVCPSDLGMSGRLAREWTRYNSQHEVSKLMTDMPRLEPEERWSDRFYILNNVILILLAIILPFILVIPGLSDFRELLTVMELPSEGGVLFLVFLLYHFQKKLGKYIEDKRSGGVP